MAITTIIGLVLGFLFVITAISTQGGFSKVLVFLDPGSFILVIGCSIASLITNYTFREIWSGLKSLKFAFIYKVISPEVVIELLVKMAAKARKEGFLSLKELATETKFSLLELGAGLIADGTDPEITKEILQTKADAEAESLAANERLWRDLSIYLPMFGMLGTIIGLVLMLRGLSDPASIGPAMALALITTFYGILLSGIICLPIAGKIHNYNEKINLIRTLIIEGLISIQAGDNSQIVKEKLMAYLSKK